MTKEGLLNPEGVYNRENAEKMIQKLPVNLAELGVPLFLKCGEDSGNLNVQK